MAEIESVIAVITTLFQIVILRQIAVISVAVWLDPKKEQHFWSTDMNLFIVSLIIHHVMFSTGRSWDFGATNFLKS